MAAALNAAPGTWAAGGGPVALLAGAPELDAAAPGPEGNRIDAGQAPEHAEAIRAHLEHVYAGLDAEGIPGDARPRLFDAAPRNALRVPFLAAVFPDASFVYLNRDPLEAWTDSLGAWQSGKVVTHPELEGWEGPPWSFPLTPGWQELSGKSLPETVVGQWTRIASTLLADLESLAPARWCVAGLDQLLANPEDETQRLFKFLGIGWHRGCDASFKQAAAARSQSPPPQPPPELRALAQRGAEVAERAEQWVAPAGDGGRIEGKVRIFHTDGLPQLLGRLNSSLLVTTYQTNQLISIRRQGDQLDTHFRRFKRPMGIATFDGGFALGARAEVLDYRNFAAMAAGLEPKGMHDACFMPRNSHYTGDIAIHDLEFAGGELWAVATRFSCLATFDTEHSFVPRWKPPFISELAAEDRCHLNGLACIGGKPKYVTALGEFDTAGGWRASKATGGIIMDVDTGETVVGGLSMPHSPRWHDDRLWVLESGKGSLAIADPETGEVETVAQVPGFTRGLAFSGDIAFIGLSQIRETATFGGLPIEKLDKRECGVWAVNTATGKTIGFLRFEDTIQEIFDVAFLPGIAFPEIAEPESTVAETSWFLPKPI